MRRSSDLAATRQTLATMVELTSAFEGIASLRIAQTKDLVQQSQVFFDDMWDIYSQLRMDGYFRFGRSRAASKPIPKELMILITSEGSFSGDIDRRLINEALAKYDPDQTAIIVIGHHGALQLAQRGVPYIRNFKTPERDLYINTQPIIEEVQKYRSTVVYYQRYESLSSQEVLNIHLGSAVTERGNQARKSNKTINESDYIFEPSTTAVVDHLERSMMQIILNEVILESKLAQYASRFRAMSAARDKAQESFDDNTVLYNRARRHEKDERLKEIINGLREA